MRAIANGPDHFEHIADEIASSYPERILDAGCGSGSLLVALGHRQRKALGVDIALRWLVISRKRLMEAGIEPQLICADMLRPPLRAESASAIVAFDLVEHTGDIDQTARSIASLMRPGGMAWVSAPNRFTLGPHPSVRLWGIGFLPIRAARSVCRWLKGADSLRFVEFTTPAKVADALIRAGLTVNSINPRKLSDVFRENYSGLDNLLIRAYRRLCRTRLGSRLLVWIGPIAEIRATSPGTPTE
jgi:2-polyprenyl-3-methyl-5-hydroxy-6-metoxy-1,4-benzoquinol methylase